MYTIGKFELKFNIFHVLNCPFKFLC